MANHSELIIGDLWDEEEYSDAKIIMGQKLWHVHRWVICKQSGYFQKALNGRFNASKPLTRHANKRRCPNRAILFQESGDREINLTDSPFSEEEVDDMLKYLYFNKLNKHQIADPVVAFVIADYFQVTSLCSEAAIQLRSNLDELIEKGHVVRFKDCCYVALKHADTQIERAVINILAGSIKWVLHESDAWDELTDAYPSLAKEILRVIYPEPTEISTERPAGFAFKDICAVNRDSIRRANGAENSEPMAGFHHPMSLTIREASRENVGGTG